MFLSWLYTYRMHNIRLFILYGTGNKNEDLIKSTLNIECELYEIGYVLFKIYFSIA